MPQSHQGSNSQRDDMFQQRSAYPRPMGTLYSGGDDVLHDFDMGKQDPISASPAWDDDVEMSWEANDMVS
jgi:hypothetical protein